VPHTKSPAATGTTTAITINCPALEFGCDGVELWQWPRLLIE
jgi:hypothetical protein